jgi:hypothetical protein
MTTSERSEVAIRAHLQRAEALKEWRERAERDEVEYYERYETLRLAARAGN